MNPRLRAYAVTIVVAGLVASPLFGAFASDSFPISTYPMFAYVRSTEATVPHVILVGVDGDNWSAPPAAVANAEVLQAQSTLRQALRQGDAAMVALCERIARQVSGSGAKLVQIVTSRYDAVRYYQGKREPLSRVLHITCEAQP